MGLLDKMWDDVAGGPSPDNGLGKLRNLSTKPMILKDGGGESSNSNKMYQRSMSMPASPQNPSSPSTPSSPLSAGKSNVWRSVFNPGTNPNTKNLGANLFDNPQPNSPTIYDWLYSGETRTRSNHR